METLFVVLSLNIGRKSSKEIWPLQGFFTVSLLLADLYPVKTLALLWCQEFNLRIGGKIILWKSTIPFQDVSYCTSKHEKSFWEL